MSKWEHALYTGLICLWIESTLACDETHTADSGVFMSPNYPNGYPPNKECTFIIAPLTPSATLRLIFDDFSTEKFVDGVNIYDEHDELITSISGGRYRWIVMETRPRFRVVFVSDSSKTYAGFTASWSVAPSFVSLDYKIAMTVWCPIGGLYEPIGDKSGIREHEVLGLPSWHDCLLFCNTLSECLYFSYADDVCIVLEENADYAYPFPNIFKKVIGGQ